MFERLLGARIQPSIDEMKFVSPTNVRVEDSVATLAAKMCQGRDFPLYLDRRQRQKFGKTEDEWPDGSHNGLQARDWLCKACGVRIWSELDTNPEAGEAFIQIYNRFTRWQARRMGKA
ncbi:hypothetical protein Q427_30105 [Halomonas sp. BC04]|nr:hypothetical protein Q427_30105 [Halomonas sp. BC04]